MKKILFLIILLFSTGCFAQEGQVAVQDNSGSWTITISNQDATAAFLNFFADFDGSSFEIMEMDQTCYLFSKGEHAVYRINLEVSTNFLQFATTGLTAESCSGVNCSHCVFKEGGGCDCQKTGDIMGESPYCNHSVSK